MSFHEFGAAINRQDWSFENRAPRDEKRYKEKIRDAVKDGLEDLVSDGSVITADPNSKKLVRVPTKSLELQGVSPELCGASLWVCARWIKSCAGWRENRASWRNRRGNRRKK